MRRVSGQLQPPPTLHVDLAERLHGAAARLARLPDDEVASLSVTVGWEGRREADVRTLALAAASAAGLVASVQGDGDVVTVRFARGPRQPAD